MPISTRKRPANFSDDEQQQQQEQDSPSVTSLTTKKKVPRSLKSLQINATPALGGSQRAPPPLKPGTKVYSHGGGRWLEDEHTREEWLNHDAIRKKKLLEKVNGSDAGSSVAESRTPLKRKRDESEDGLEEEDRKDFGLAQRTESPRDRETNSVGRKVKRARFSSQVVSSPPSRRAPGSAQSLASQQSQFSSASPRKSAFVNIVHKQKSPSVTKSPLGKADLSVSKGGQRKGEEIWSQDNEDARPPDDRASDPDEYADYSRSKQPVRRDSKSDHEPQVASTSPRATSGASQQKTQNTGKALSLSGSASQTKTHPSRARMSETAREMAKITRKLSRAERHVRDLKALQEFMRAKMDAEDRELARTLAEEAEQNAATRPTSNTSEMEVDAFERAETMSARPSVSIHKSSKSRPMSSSRSRSVSVNGTVRKSTSDDIVTGTSASATDDDAIEASAIDEQLQREQAAAEADAARARPATATSNADDEVDIKDPTGVRSKQPTDKTSIDDVTDSQIYNRDRVFNLYVIDDSDSNSPARAKDTPDSSSNTSCNRNPPRPAAKSTARQASQARTSSTTVSTDRDATSDNATPASDTASAGATTNGRSKFHQRGLRREATTAAAFEADDASVEQRSYAEQKAARDEELARMRSWAVVARVDASGREVPVDGNV